MRFTIKFWLNQVKAINKLQNKNLKDFFLDFDSISSGEKGERGDNGRKGAQVCCSNILECIYLNRFSPTFRFETKSNEKLQNLITTTNELISLYDREHLELTQSILQRENVVSLE